MNIEMNADKVVVIGIYCFECVIEISPLINMCGLVKELSEKSSHGCMLRMGE